MRGKSRHHGQQRSLYRRQFWPKKQSHVNARRALGMPRASRPAAPCGLLFCQDDRALRFACMSQFQRYSIRRIRLEKMKYVFSEKAALQLLLQHVRSQDIGDLLQEVSGAWLA